MLFFRDHAEKNINMRRLKMTTIAAVMVMVVVIFAPFASYAADSPGGDLPVRVGYFGDDDDYRTKSVLSNSEIQSLGMQTRYYTNVTNVGTIMYMAAQGPRLSDVLSKAGIDLNSVQAIHIRTADRHNEKNSWYGSFPAKSYLSEARYYYPAINGLWEVSEEGGSGTPQKGALKGAVKVDTILAVKSYSTKNPIEARDMKNLASKMDTQYSYRMCAGQKPLTEGVKTTPAAVTANETAYKIFGIDVQLYGSPPDGNVKLGINIDMSNVKVGSRQNLSAVMSGKDFFGEDIKGDITWSSSNEDVAVIGKTSGELQVISEGETVITATLTTTDGTKKTASITINTKKTGKNSGGAGGAAGGTSDGDKKGEKTKGKGIGLTCREVSVNMHSDVVYDRNEMSDDAIALAKEKPDPKVMMWAGIVAAVLFSAGLVFRLRRFRLDI